MYYLLPERSCVPDSPVWFSGAQELPQHQIDKMLQVNLIKFFEIGGSRITLASNRQNVTGKFNQDLHYFKEFEFYRQKINKYFFGGKIQIED